jgi:hypothetical protein
MPIWHEFFNVLNRLTDREHIASLDPQFVAPGMSLLDAAEEGELFMHAGMREFMASTPCGLLESMRALIYYNLTRTDADGQPLSPLPMTFAWLPGYDHELTISQTENTEQTAGGITVVVRSRFPNDPHPLAKRPVSE